MEHVKSIMGTIIGLIIAGGAAAAWHYWKIDGLIAVLVAFGGISLTAASLGIKNDYV